MTTYMTGRLQLIAALTLAMLLAACGSAPQKPTSSSTARPTSAPVSSPAQSGAPAPNLPKAGSGRGAYYKDDGPGDNPPPGLDLTLDAEPKIEPYSSSGNKPYVVFGKTYTPILDDKPFTQRGTGSWYGKKFHGQKTSSGELYDMYKMTAAHPTLPIPSYARITNLSNGKQVIVKINDRGPFHTNRIVDLSYTAALKLDYLSKGSSELLLERLLPADIERMAENRKNNPVVVASAPQSAPPVAVAAVATVVSVPVVIATAPVVTPLPPSIPVQSTVAATQSGPALDALIAEKTAAESDSERTASANVVASTGAAPTSTPAPIPAVTTNPNPASGYYLQFGAFGLRSNAEATFAHLQSKLAQLPDFEIVQQGTLYRLFSGPFASREEANDAVQMAVNVGVPKPIIIQR